ncbi:cyclase family protein [Micromonospora sp. HUAS LYJ1]|uniref:cyclase family protein n=1 Tax=Micromonospora sp. HUAS LYJ1 TaxID=3061626 RepID=UPI00267376F7|nr:cyclase family protein [Micromonospora sp. HUAS LYJ1]WKU08484.1 cyclase family protein [Micromonospora sp. HUAS LYJ1]
MIDISQGWHEGMPSYDAPWYPRFEICRAMTPWTDPTGGGRTFSDLRLFPHNGTHVESGFHFFEDREKIDEVPLDTFVGRACIADLSRLGDLEPVSGDDLERVLRDIWQRGDRLLIRTDHPNRHLGRDDYWDSPPYLTPSSADWMVDNDAVLVGLDCITERPDDRSGQVHRRLLAAGIPILENIQNLDQVSGSVVQLMALPVKIAGVEAAPARAVVFDGWPFSSPSDGTSTPRLP